MTTHHTVPITCPECQGTGDNPEAPWRPCPWCMGNAVVYVTEQKPASPPPVVDEPPGRDL